MLHLEPSTVRSDSIASNVPRVPEGFEIDLVDRGPVTLGLSVDMLSAQGQLGEGALGSADKGERFFAAVVEATSQALSAFMELDVTRLKPEA